MLVEDEEMLKKRYISPVFYNREVPGARQVLLLIMIDDK